MTNNTENIVVCCFCGDSLTLESSVQLSIFFDNNSDETQGLFCHKKCLDKSLHKSVTRHPDIFDDNESSTNA